MATFVIWRLEPVSISNQESLEWVLQYDGDNLGDAHNILDALVEDNKELPVKVQYAEDRMIASEIEEFEEHFDDLFDVDLGF